MGEISGVTDKDPMDDVTLILVPLPIILLRESTETDDRGVITTPEISSSLSANPCAPWNPWGEFWDRSFVS